MPNSRPGVFQKPDTLSMLRLLAVCRQRQGDGLYDPLRFNPVREVARSAGIIHEHFGLEVIFG